MTPEATIISALCGAVGTLAGVIAWLYRNDARRSEARMAHLEQREDELLTAMSATLTQLAATCAAIYEAEKKLTDYVTEQQVLSRLQWMRGGSGAGHGGGPAQGVPPPGGQP